jgi:ribonuclease VapC
MIIDSSAVIAILSDEPEAGACVAALLDAAVRRISAVNFVETAIVVDRRRDPIVSRRLDELLNISDIRIEPVTEAQAHLARAAHRDFGRRSGHPARLNLGDCFAYALARDTGEPLLFKGDDFTHTDVTSALP